MTAFKGNVLYNFSKPVALGIVIAGAIKQAQLKLDAARADVPIDAKVVAVATAELKAATDRQTTEQTNMLNRLKKKDGVNFWGLEASSGRPGRR